MDQYVDLTDYDGDIFFYYGPIDREGYNQISAIYESKHNKKKKCCLVLVTYGGDPDAAYRIARATNHHYEEFEVLIPDICKSAGTLLCIGASRLIFGDRGELGPLDIQLSKPDEMFENMSGLDLIQAINGLQTQLLDAFRSYLLEIRGGSRIKTKMAADIAVKLADGFINPIASRIDPVTLGEHQRAMQIAFDYGERLNAMVQSLKPNALISLVGSYSSHGFVIDRKEAAELFVNVAAPEGATANIYDFVRGIINKQPHPRNVIVADLVQLTQSQNGTFPEGMADEESISDDGSEAEDFPETDGDASAQSEKNE